MTTPGAAPALDVDHVLGTLRALEARLRDRETRMAGEIRAALDAVAAVHRDLDTARAAAAGAAELRTRQAEMEHDLELAEKVHRSLLPPASAQGEDLVCEARYRPMRGVGGDLCLVLPCGPGQTFLCVADVTGHGVAAALLATRIHGHLRRLVDCGAGPAEALTGLNDFVLGHFGDTGLFLTCFTVRCDTRAGEWRLAGAGHPPALLWRRGAGTVARVGSQATLLGVLPTLPGGGETTLPLARGDRLVLYTDGITETRSRSGSCFGFDAIERVLRGAAGAPAAEGADAILRGGSGVRAGGPHDAPPVRAG